MTDDPVLARTVGEIGGRGGAESMGIEIFESPEPDLPRPHQIGDIGVHDGNVAVLKYLGMSQQLSPHPFVLSNGQRALEGSPAFMAEQMVRDPKVVNFFAHHPELWERLKDGEAAIELFVFHTTHPPTEVTMRSGVIELHHLNVPAMERAIAALA